MALKQHAWAISLVLGTLVGDPLAYAGKLLKVWEVDLKRVVQRKDGNPDFPVFAFRFSPDGRKLAVIADMLGARGMETSRLLVLDLDHPATGIKEFKVRFGANDRESVRMTASFGWSPSGEIIHAAGSVVHVADGKTCEVPHVATFIKEGLAISGGGPLSPSDASSHFTFYDGECQEDGKWEVPESWLVEDVSTVSVRGIPLEENRAGTEDGAWRAGGARSKSGERLKNMMPAG